jgi:hypothetical protein
VPLDAAEHVTATLPDGPAHGWTTVAKHDGRSGLVPSAYLLPMPTPPEPAAAAAQESAAAERRGGGSGGGGGGGENGTVGGAPAGPVADDDDDDDDDEPDAAAADPRGSHFSGTGGGAPSAGIDDADETASDDDDDDARAKVEAVVGAPVDACAALESAAEASAAMLDNLTAAAATAAADPSVDASAAATSTEAAAVAAAAVAFAFAAAEGGDAAPMWPLSFGATPSSAYAALLAAAPAPHPGAAPLSLPPLHTSEWHTAVAPFSADDSPAASAAIPETVRAQTKLVGLYRFLCLQWLGGGRGGYMEPRAWEA